MQNIDMSKCGCEGFGRQKQHQRNMLACIIKSFYFCNHAVCVKLFSNCFKKIKYICCLPMIKTTYASFLCKETLHCKSTFWPAP